MSDKIPHLRKSMADVFSFVSINEALNVSREFVQDYLDRAKHVDSQIHWAEFEPDWLFVRGGITDMAAMSSRIIIQAEADTRVKNIIDSVETSGLRPGELLEAADKSGHYWCVPHSSLDIMNTPQNRMRVIFLTSSIFFEIIKLFNSDAKLTPSEIRMVYQIVTGLNPSIAAKVDAVSTETKRTHLKSAMAKLDCHRQVELVRLCIGQLIHLLYVCEAETSHTQLIERFGDKYFGHTARLCVQRLPNGRVVRFWEFGPSNGNPVFVMHGYIFPFLVLDAEEYLRRHSLRLIMPVRIGYLDEQPLKFDLDYHQDAVQQNVEDATMLAEQLLETPIPLLGQGMGGGIYALLLAKHRPDLFKTVLVVSINLMRTDHSDMTAWGKFLKGFRALTADIDVYKIAKWRFDKAVLSTRRTSRIFLRSLFSNSPSDLKVLERVLANAPAFECWREIANQSKLGVETDHYLLSKRREKYLEGLTVPVTFLHAPEDPITSLSELREFTSSSPLAKCALLNRGGHYASASHPSDFWAEIKARIDG